jgi:hypothetical protein
LPSSSLLIVIHNFKCGSFDAKVTKDKLNLIKDCLCIVQNFRRHKKMKSNFYSHDKNSSSEKHFLASIDSKVAEKKMNKIYKGVCQHRQFLEDLLQQNSLPTDLKSHLYLLLTSPTKSSSSTILTTLKTYYSDDIIKALMNAIDSKAIKMFDATTMPSCANDALCERLDEVFTLNINY